MPKNTHLFLASTKIYWNFGVNIIQTNLPYLHPSPPNICGLIVSERLTKKFVIESFQKNINFVNGLIKEAGKFKTWEQITREFNIDKNLYFKWNQLVHAIPNYWKKTLTENTINSQNLSYLNHDLIKSNQIHSVEKLKIRELYLISLQHETKTPSSQKYFQSMFQDLTLQWKHTYTLPRIPTIDSKF